MPRVRKQVARFDPSPEAVAPWNDTSRKVRIQIDLQARVRHRLTSDEAAALAAASAPTTSAAGEQTTNLAPLAPSNRKPSVPAPGRKRQRASTLGGAVGAGASSTAAAPPPYETPTWPPMPELHTGDREQGGSGVRLGSFVTDSSISCSTSGSDSDSSYSCASVMSDQNMPWRRHAPPAAGDLAADADAVAGGGGAGGGDAGAGGEAGVGVGVGPVPSATASVSGTDTDSEYCSDLIAPQGSAASATSDGCSSCLTAPLEAAAGGSCADCGGGGGDCVAGAGIEAVAGEAAPQGGKTRAREENDDADERERAEKRRNVVTVRLARSQMPQRWATPPPPFKTCLDGVRPEDRLGGGMGDGGGDDTAAAAAAAASMLGLSEEEGVDSKNWLYSGLIDVVMAKLARTYPNVHFMPIDFAVLCLNGWGSEAAAAAVPSSLSTAGSDDGDGGGVGVGVSEGGSAAEASSAASAAAAAAAAAALPDQNMVFQDILGRPIMYAEKRPVIFLTHVNNVHWNLLRVEHNPVPELQLFEPMGKPPRRQGGSRTNSGAAAPSASRGTGFRCIPKEVYRWLDTVWPLGSEDGAGGNASGSPSSSSSAAMSSAGNAGGGSASATSSVSGSSKGKATSQTPSHDGWASHAYSAITRQQQTTGFDCGVASLLYAEKCGQGQMREDVDAWTTQGDMTEYRRALQRYFKDVVGQADAGLDDDDAGHASANEPLDTSPEASAEESVETAPLSPPPIPSDPPKIVTPMSDAELPGVALVTSPADEPAVACGLAQPFG